jgi:hypothetical protein
MTMPILPLAEIAQRIQLRQAELEALRRDYETRQTQLAELKRRQQELRGQLAQVEREIAAASRGHVTAPAPAVPSRPPASPATAPNKAPALSLPDFLIAEVRQAKQAMTVKELVETVTRKKFPTGSRNLPELIKSQVKRLVQRGVLRRAKNGPGVVPAAAKLSVPVAGKPAAKSTSRPPAKPGAQRPSLKDILARLVQKSQRPLSSGELARQATAAGFQTKSADFANVVGVTLSKMDNVERVPGQGYRLKKR